MERDHLEDLGVDGWVVLKWVLNEGAGEAWSGWLWLTVGTCGGRL
jgi:hypothetical protein